MGTTLQWSLVVSRLAFSCSILLWLVGVLLPILDKYDDRPEAMKPKLRELPYLLKAVPKPCYIPFACMTALLSFFLWKYPSTSLSCPAVWEISEHGLTAPAQRYEWEEMASLTLDYKETQYRGRASGVRSYSRSLSLLIIMKDGRQITLDAPPNVYPGVSGYLTVSQQSVNRDAWYRIASNYAPHVQFRYGNGENALDSWRKQYKDKTRKK